MFNCKQCGRYEKLISYIEHPILITNNCNGYNRSNVKVNKHELPNSPIYFIGWPNRHAIEFPKTSTIGLLCWCGPTTPCDIWKLHSSNWTPMHHSRTTFTSSNKNVHIIFIHQPSPERHNMPINATWFMIVQ